MLANILKAIQTTSTNLLPQVLEIHKRKLLIVMNRTDEEINHEDQLLLQNFYFEKQLKPTDVKENWDDSEAIEIVEEILSKHANFHLNKYLDCSQNICDAFSDKNNSYPEVYSSMEYVLTHARQFGDSDYNIFDLESIDDDFCEEVYKKGTARLKDMTEIVDAKTVVPATQLIDELKIEYDENVYKRLNAYITSFVLILLRRSIRNETDCIFYTPRALVIYAYVTTTDVKTKQNLQEACIKYMEWYDMQMPYLFCKVLNMYEIEANVLWDLLSDIEYPKNEISMSLINFAAEYYTKYMLQKAYPLQRQLFFPFCRLFDNKYHKNLSNGNNLSIIAVLYELVKRKNVTEEFAFKITDIINKYSDKWIMFVASQLSKQIIENLVVMKNLSGKHLKTDISVRIHHRFSKAN